MAMALGLITNPIIWIGLMLIAMALYIGNKVHIWCDIFIKSHLVCPVPARYQMQVKSCVRHVLFVFETIHYGQLLFS